jgi:hypothetical protein
VIFARIMTPGGAVKPKADLKRVRQPFLKSGAL